MKNYSIDQNKILLIGGCGYIGSYLYQKLVENGFEVTICDYLARGNPLNLDILYCDYAELDKFFLQKFGTVLWFAGQSSVIQSMNDPNRALINNCFNLFHLSQKLHPRTKFIYASSGSVYSTKNKYVKEVSEIENIEYPSQTPYDISKFSFDYIAKNYLKNFYSLRMGTLAGYSPNLRDELLFNSMNISAINTGKIHLRNANSYRTILFLEDLFSLILKLITTKQQPGIINVGSVSYTIGEFASKIANLWNSKIINHKNTKTYSFKLNCSRMEAIFGHYNKVISFEDRCRSFSEKLKFYKPLQMNVNQ